MGEPNAENVTFKAIITAKDEYGLQVSSNLEIKVRRNNSPKVIN